MRRIKEEIGDSYNDRVAFYIVGIDPSEGIHILEADRKREGFPWLTAYADQGMMEKLQIYTQPSKLAFNRNGIITHRYGFGKGDFENWSALFDDIADN